jgi:hypothetical protein
VEGEVILDVLSGPWAADRTQEGLNDHPKPQPVGWRIGCVSHDWCEIVNHALLREFVQLFPDPWACHVKD